MIIGPVVVRTLHHATLGPRGKNLAQQHYLSGFGRKVISAHRGQMVRQRTRLHFRWRRTRKGAVWTLECKVGLRNGRQKGGAVRVECSINTCKNTRGKGRHREGVGHQEHGKDRRNHRLGCGASRQS